MQEHDAQGAQQQQAVSSLGDAGVRSGQAQPKAQVLGVAESLFNGETAAIAVDYLGGR
jgi:hypothetical protein